MRNSPQQRALLGCLGVLSTLASLLRVIGTRLRGVAGGRHERRRQEEAYGPVHRAGCQVPGGALGLRYQGDKREVVAICTTVVAFVRLQDDGFLDWTSRAFFVMRCCWLWFSMQNARPKTPWCGSPISGLVVAVVGSGFLVHQHNLCCFGHVQ